MQTVTKLLNKSSKKLAEIKGDICKSTIIVGYFTIPLSATYRTSGERNKAFKDIENLNSTKQCDLIGIYRTLQPTEYIFSNEQGTFTKRDHMLGHKTSFNKFKRTEIIQSIFSNHNGTELAINNKKIRTVL